MNIAVACSGLDVAAFLDSAECFTCYSAPKGVMSGCRTFPNPKKTVSDLAGLLSALSMDVLICGSMTQSQLDCFEAEGLQVVVDERGPASGAAHAFLASHMTCSFDDED